MAGDAARRDLTALRAVRIDTGNDAAQDDFAALVESALADLPADILESLENVCVVIEEEPDDALLESLGTPEGETILGLYDGIPLPERAENEPLLMPAVVTLFRGPLEDAADGDRDTLVREVRITVLHEIAHHFGISHERMDELGVY